MVQTLNLLRKLKEQKKITKQEYRTYRGQVLSGDIKGCLVGLKRKKLIQEKGVCKDG